MRSVILTIDPYLGRAITSFLAKKSATPAPRDFTQEELSAIRNEVKLLADLPLPTDRDLKRVEIIVLKYKDPEVETACATRVIENTEWPYKLNFFDNRRGTKNMSKIWNQLIKESTCDYVVIMDSDAFVPKLEPCWLTKMMQTFDEEENCFVVSPKVTRTSGVQQKAQAALDGKPQKLTTEFAGMCVLYKKEIFDKLGYFDEDFLLYGSDTEWAHRLIHSPYGAYVRSDVLVEHEGHYSTKKAAKTDPVHARLRLIEGEYANMLLKEKRGG